MFLLFVGCPLLAPIGPIVDIGVFWLEGEAHKYYNTDQQTIYVSVQNVLNNELKIPITENQKMGEYIWIKAGDTDQFKIKIHHVRDNITKLSIRVNNFGDKPYAEMIYRHVDAQPGVIQWTSIDELNAAMKSRRR